MELCRFNDDRLGLVLDDHVVDVSNALHSLPSRRWAYPHGDPLIANLGLLQSRIQLEAQTGTRLPIGNIALRAWSGSNWAEFNMPSSSCKQRRISHPPGLVYKQSHNQI